MAQSWFAALCNPGTQILGRFGAFWAFLTHIMELGATKGWFDMGNLR